MGKIRDLDLLNEINILYHNKIVLYGAGDYGKRAIKLMEQLGIHILGVCDSDEGKVGKKIAGYKILSILELSQIFKKESLIIIMTMARPSHINQVLDNLDQYGMTDIACYTYFALKFSVEFHINDPRIKECYRENFQLARKMYNANVYGDRVNLIRRYIWASELHDVVLVLTPRKVGTTSVAESLIKSSIYSIQTDRLMPGSWTNEKAFDKNEWLHFLKSEKRIRVISLIRDPISRAISDYFYGLCMDGYSRNYLTIKPNIYQGINAFIEAEIKVGEYGSVFEWFNQEIEGAFGIDIYQHNFDKEKGYTIICKDNIELLLIKMEKLNDCQEVIGQFAGVEGFQLIRENEGSEKLYKFAYDEFKKTVEIPQHIINFYYANNKKMDYFYTTEEKDYFRKKWTR